MADFSLQYADSVQVLCFLVGSCTSEKPCPIPILRGEPWLGTTYLTNFQKLAPEGTCGQWAMRKCYGVKGGVNFLTLKNRHNEVATLFMSLDFVRMNLVALLQAWGKLAVAWGWQSKKMERSWGLLLLLLLLLHCSSAKLNHLIFSLSKIAKFPCI